MRLRPIQPRHRPGQRLRRLVRPLHARPDRAMARPQVIAEPADHQTDPLQIRALRLKLVQRHHQARLPVRRVQVLCCRPGQPVAPHHRLGGEHELPGSWDQAHAFQPVLQPRRVSPRSPENLEAQLRGTIAVRPQRQILEHHIGRAAIRRCRPLHRLDQRIGRLRHAAPMHPHRHARQVHQPAVSPDPSDAIDLALAQGDGEAQEVVVLDRARPALAAGRGAAGLQKARRPDHLSRHPGPPEHTGHRRAFGGPLHLQRLQTRSSLARRLEAGDSPLVDHPPESRSDHRPDRPADRLTDAAQDHLRHAQPPRLGSTTGQRNAATSRARHHDPIQLSTTARPQ